MEQTGFLGLATSISFNTVEADGLMEQQAQSLTESILSETEHGLT